MQVWKLDQEKENRNLRNWDKDLQHWNIKILFIEPSKAYFLSPVRKQSLMGKKTIPIEKVLSGWILIEWVVYFFVSTEERGRDRKKRRLKASQGPGLEETIEDEKQDQTIETISL